MYFNIEGVCYPGQHYMVNIEKQITEIRNLIDSGKYFTINRARQYGKTTTLNLLEQEIKDKYIVFLISFEGLANESYASERVFCQTVAGLLLDVIEFDGITGISEESRNAIEKMSNSESGNTTLRALSNLITRLCMTASKPVVLMIDEVDQASGQEIFLSFLGLLRNKYQNRTKRPTFQSVILAGVRDIKNLKLKIAEDGRASYNSPWNIAAEFVVDMSFDFDGIQCMLETYKEDKNLYFDTAEMARWIFEYTSGYPYLVSYLCKKMDEGVSGNIFLSSRERAWTKEGFLEALKILVKGPNTLYDDMVKHVVENKVLYTMLDNILFKDEDYPYQAYDRAVDIGYMYGFVKEQDGIVKVSNRVFETQLYNYFLSEELKRENERREMLPDRNQFVHEGNLNMDLVMTKYYETSLD